jgi:hypothetical protein
LDQTISISVVALKPQKLAHCVETVHMFGVKLRELEEGVDVVRVFDDLVLTLKGIIFLGGLKPKSVVLALYFELLPYLEELANAWRKH